MDDIKVNQNPKLGSLDRPNSYIGRSLPRENAKKHLDGGGQFVDDLTLPRMVHVAFLRSPFAHAEIKSINTIDAKKSDGVIDVFTAKEIDEVCKPWIGTLGHLGEMRSPEQAPLAKKIAEPRTIVAIIEPTYDSNKSAPIPATSPTLSPTLSAIVAGFSG